MAEPKLAHIVYFTLKDNSPAAIAKQLDACQKYLTDHPGVVFFAVGTRTPAWTREVNDKDFRRRLARGLQKPRGPRPISNRPATRQVHRREQTQLGQGARVRRGCGVAASSSSEHRNKIPRGADSSWHRGPIQGSGSQARQIGRDLRRQRRTRRAGHAQSVQGGSQSGIRKRPVTATRPTGTAFTKSRRSASRRPSTAPSRGRRELPRRPMTFNDSR